MQTFSNYSARIPSVLGKTGYHLAKVSVPVFVPLIFYWQDFKILAGEALSSEVSTHIILIPFFIAYLLYRKRRVIQANIENKARYDTNLYGVKLSWIVGVLLCVLAYLISWRGNYTFTPLEYHLFSLPLLVAGLVLIMFNFATLRAVLAPILFLLFLFPPPIVIAQYAGTVLSAFSALSSYRILSAAGFPVTLNDQYGSPIIYLTLAGGEIIPFVIDVSCSGLYSLIGLTVFAVFFSYISKGPITKKIIMFISGYPILFALNIIRITLLFLIGYYFGTGMALNVFHLLGGWTLIFLGTLAITLIAERLLGIGIRWRAMKTCEHEEADLGHCHKCGLITRIDPSPISRTDAVKILAIFLIAVTLTSFQVPVFALTGGPAEVFVRAPSGDVTLTRVFPQIEGYTLRFIYRDTNFERASGQNASLLYEYRSTVDNHPTWVQLEVARTRASLHRREVCLISYPQLVGRVVRLEQLDLRDVQIKDNPPITARYFAYYDPTNDFTEVSLYWFTESIFRSGDEFVKMFTKISLIKYAPSPDQVSSTEAAIYPIAQEIADYWQPIITWSLLEVLIAKHGLILIGIVSTALVALLVYDQLDKRRRRETAMSLLSRITEAGDRAIFDSLHLGEGKPLTCTEILENFKKLTGLEIEYDALSRKLEGGEDMGVVTRGILDVDDAPYMAWKLTHLASNPVKYFMLYLLKIR